MLQRNSSNYDIPRRSVSLVTPVVSLKANMIAVRTINNKFNKNIQQKRETNKTLPRLNRTSDDLGLKPSSAPSAFLNNSPRQNQPLPKLQRYLVIYFLY